ncbi:hypothetical protein [Paenibacillus pini]|uniref:Uncharacterized protein n=1 Tax=Paenibacillus pini JCM 16418 TaxID=1236976 RepID=W7YGY7_9BACL|nr:hypothetical protein [Paenibacillus pini]GAF07732.1 hypothetical protein JCM16418_1760 [Paenibacillus pini JCM 16418]
MEKLMEVGDVFESKENGTIIVGINPALASLNKIGDNIVLRTPENKELELEVVSVQISNSPTDKKMVGICLGKSIKPIDIPLGSMVYLVS